MVSKFGAVVFEQALAALRDACCVDGFAEPLPEDDVADASSVAGLLDSGATDLSCAPLEFDLIAATTLADIRAPAGVTLRALQHEYSVPGGAAGLKAESNVRVCSYTTDR